jgi:hypothetical protein
MLKGLRLPIVDSSRHLDPGRVFKELTLSTTEKYADEVREPGY